MVLRWDQRRCLIPIPPRLRQRSSGGRGETRSQERRELLERHRQRPYSAEVALVYHRGGSRRRLEIQRGPHLEMARRSVQTILMVV